MPWRAPYVGSHGAWTPRTPIAKMMKDEIRRQYKGELIREAIDCELIFYMAIPKATSKKKRMAMLSGEIRPTTTPDRINTGKFYEDLLQGIVIDNDSKIVGGNVSKYYDEKPRTVILIRKPECKRWLG